MADRYAEDIRRIVKIDETASDIGSAKVKTAIGGKRGIGYMTADGQGTAGVSGNAGGSSTPTTLQPDSTTSNAENSGNVENQNGPSNGDSQGGSMVDANNPQSSVYSGGNYDITNIIDMTGERPTIPSSIGTGSGKLFNSSGGTVNNIEGVIDCESGKGLDLRLDGLVKPPEGWQPDGSPPPGYVDDGIPEVTSASGEGLDVWGFSAGTRWGIVPSSGFPEWRYFSVVGPAIKEAIATSVATGTLSEIKFVAAGSGLPDRYQIWWEGPSFLATIFKEGCEIGVDPGCPAERPTDIPLPKWGPDDKMQLIYIDNKWQYSESESSADIIPKYTDNQNSSLNFCFGAGGARTGVVRPTADGGTIMYETAGGAPTGVATILGPDRKVAGYTDAGGIQSYLPPSE